MANPVYMIGLDACDIVLLQRWAEDGDLPHFAQLMREGVRGRLFSSAAVMQGSIWPTFATARDPGEQGDPFASAFGLHGSSYWPVFSYV